MPVVWTVDPEKRLMTAVAEGAVTRADIETFFAETAAANVAPYRKLFDASAVTTALSPEDMLALGVQMRALNQVAGEMGPLALVLPLAMMDRARRMVGIMAVADRPLQVFDDVEAARAWIEEQGPAQHRTRKSRVPGRPRKV